PRSQLIGHLSPLLAGCLGIVLSKSSADPGGDDATLGLAGIRYGVAHEVHAASLPGGAEHFADGRLQSLMSIGDDELDAAQAASGQTAQELCPERLGLTVANGHAKHFAPAIGVDRDSDDHRYRYYMMVTPRFDVGGIQPEIRPVALDRPVQEGLHPLVDLDAEPRDLAFADPVHPHSLDQLIH